jgi:hypothetical protein
VRNAALIVVGSAGPRSSLLGSVSADVSRRAPCPVVVVAPGAEGPLADGSETASRLDASSVAGTTRFRARAGGARDGEALRGGIVRFTLGAGAG